MRRSILSTSIVLTALLLAAGVADARGKHGGARRGRNKHLNMPPGWTWPPSPEMRDEGRACLGRLDELGVEWKRAPAVPKVTTPIYVPAMEIGGVKLTPIWRKGPFVMDCLLAQALADGGSESLRAAGVAELRFSGIHEYRNVHGTHILSRHALGLAIDVFAIVGDDGVTHVVARDYKQGDALLLTVESWVNESRAFRFLLTPGNDPAAHHDHFHFEARSNAERPRRLLSSK